MIIERLEAPRSVSNASPNSSTVVQPLEVTAVPVGPTSLSFEGTCCRRGDRRSLELANSRCGNGFRLPGKLRVFTKSVGSGVLKLMKVVGVSRVSEYIAPYFWDGIWRPVHFTTSKYFFWLFFFLQVDSHVLIML